MIRKMPLKISGVGRFLSGLTLVFGRHACWFATMLSINYDDPQGATYTYKDQGYVPRVGETVILRERNTGEKTFTVTKVIWSADENTARVIVEEDL